MEKTTLIIGLDLSLSCTGITTTLLKDNVGQKMNFFRVLFDDMSTKSGKRYNPRPITNVKDVTYTMPSNITVDTMVIDKTDKNNLEQIAGTLKALICTKKILKIINDEIVTHTPDKIIVSIENYIMPGFGGQNQLKIVGSLIMLQGFVRGDIIKLCLTNNNDNLQMLTPTASTLKKFFTGVGTADKNCMLKSFIDNYNGKKLIPEADINITGQVNDVIDSFALVMYAYKQII